MSTQTLFSGRIGLVSIRTLWLVLPLCAVALQNAGCMSMRGARWEAEQVAELPGFAWPEALRPDPERDIVYVANIQTTSQGGWEEDGKGFVSTITADGELSTRRWLDSSSATPLHSPKGMCVLNGKLYIADMHRLLVCSAGGPGAVTVIEPEGAAWLNDVTTDGTDLFVSDTKRGVALRLRADGTQSQIKAPPWINGITWHDGRLYCVSMKEHEIYELDPGGAVEPVPFGLAEHFEGLDGIEILPDGTFLVSDLRGNKVCTVSRDRQRVRKLIDVEWPADIALDTARALLYVPSLKPNKVVVYRLRKR